MGSSFNELIDDLAEEVLRRDAQYFAQATLEIPSLQALAAGTALRDVTEQELQTALAQAMLHLADRAIPTRVTNESQDAVGTTFALGIIDALMAEHGLVPLRPAHRNPCTLTEVLTTDYDRRQTPSGVGYFVRRQGSTPLLIVNATGVGLGIWSRLIGDPSHDFKIFIAESRTTELLPGGFRCLQDLRMDAADIADVLACEGLGSIAALAWCNGAKIAVELAATQPDRVAQLILLCPSFWSGSDSNLVTDYEENLEGVLADVLAQPKLGPMVTGWFRKMLAGTRSNAAASRTAAAEALLTMPASEHLQAILAPVATPQALLIYGRRELSDKEYPTSQQLAKTRAQLTLITGAADAIVCNELSAATLAPFAARSTHVSIAGAGHYVQDLQYTYLRMLLTTILGHGDLATLGSKLARVTVMDSSQHRHRTMSHDIAAHSAGSVRA